MTVLDVTNPNGTIDEISFNENAKKTDLRNNRWGIPVWGYEKSFTTTSIEFFWPANPIDNTAPTLNNVSINSNNIISSYVKVGHLHANENKSSNKVIK